MVSLLKLAKVTEEGVRFLSPHDGSPMLLTPEHSISLQNSIGSDIIMQLDDVIATTSPVFGPVEPGFRAAIVAFDIETGEERWRLNTDPDDDQSGPVFTPTAP